jgi:cell wall-associated NlpC family hydrolase
MFTLKSSLADLRKEPVDPAMGYEKDPLQETQILFGEKIIVKEQKGPWLRVECIEQRKYYQTLWQGYEGWTKAAIDPAIPGLENLVVVVPWTNIQAQSEIPVSFGTLLSGQKTEEGWVVNLPDGKGKMDSTAVSVIENKIEHVLKRAEMFLGNPYLWGGRSGFRTDGYSLRTSVDCSGFVNLLYRSIGVSVPRDACDQFRVCEPVDVLQPGDLIFLAKQNKPEKIYHVILYAGGDMLYESTMLSGTVRKISAQQRFGKLLVEITHQDIIGEDIIIFASFIKNNKICM